MIRISEYTVGSFGGVAFKLGDISVSYASKTLKTNMGKTFIEKQIPLRNAVDTILNVQGVIIGLSQTSGQTRATAIENDRTSLIDLDDGYLHAYSDGRHSGDFVIVKGSLVFNDEADRAEGEPYRFSVQLKEW